MTRRLDLYALLRGRPALAAIYFVAFLLLLAAVAAFVDLKPHIEHDFFFAPGDRAPRAAEKRSEFFTGESQVIISTSGDLGSSRYYAAVEALTQELQRVPGVTRVQSMTEGPKNPRRGFEGPFWKRLLGGEKMGESTLVLVWLERGDAAQVISEIQSIVERHRGDDLGLHVSGVPFVMEMIRRHLERDMLVFSTAAILVFGLITLLLFRSAAILAGVMVSCISASCATLLASELLDMKIGLLTANLVTIVFIMALHHIIYVTFNWKDAAASGAAERAELVEGAVRQMLGPSWWVMLTTLLGFGSLILTRAQPLRELGAAGALGAVIAFVVAYLFYPSFLQLARPPAPRAAPGESAEGVPRFLRRRLGWLAAAIIAAAAISSTGIGRLDKIRACSATSPRVARFAKGWSTSISTVGAARCA